jgi:phage terminase large subunit-like protein
VTNASGGSGGSGVIVLKIPSAYEASFSVGVTQTNATSGGVTTYTITAAGASDTVTFA